MKYIMIISLIVGLVRLIIPGHDLSWPGTYEAFAHIWVGILFGFIIADYYRKYSIWSLVVITVLEVIMFMLR